MIRVAVVGAGQWGPNLIRNFHNRQTSEVVCVIDRDAARLALVRARFPDVQVGPDAEPVLVDPDVDAVVVATPTSTHHRLVKTALELAAYSGASRACVPLDPSHHRNARQADELGERRPRRRLHGVTRLDTAADEVRRFALHDWCEQSSDGDRAAAPSLARCGARSRIGAAACGTPV